MPNDNAAELVERNKVIYLKGNKTVSTESKSDFKELYDDDIFVDDNEIKEEGDFYEVLDDPFEEEEQSEEILEPVYAMNDSEYEREYKKIKRFSRFDKWIEYAQKKVPDSIKAIWAKRTLIVAVLVVLAILTGVLNLISSTKVASTLMLLNYEEAAKGLNPNGTRFEMYDIKSDDVMELAIQLAQADGDITVEELKESLVVNTYYIKGIQEDATQDYIATEYMLSLRCDDTLGFGKSHISAKKMLECICNAYKEKFHDKYAANKTILNLKLDDIYNIDEIEYMDITDLFRMKISQISRYLSQRNSESESFRSEETGETFRSLLQKTQNFSDIELEKYNAFILQSGLAKNRKKYTLKLEYTNYLTNLKYRTNEAGYRIRMDVINKYDPAMATAVLVPSVDEKNEYYMSRTKVGVDNLAKDAADFNSWAKINKRVMTDAKNTIGIMNSFAQNNTDDEFQAQLIIDDMKETLVEIAELTEATDNDYIEYKTRDYISFEPRGISVINRLSIGRIILVCFGAFVVMCAGIMYANREKKHKNKDKESETI